ncbi:hypothetical protein KGA66_27735 [Actinocrinis puniceicyclus]|uniref:Uncharacterized protein n=1 Tax=Actinocrinis puniceicyclus TaxID=977794 RepID=A0A8J7WSM8_9ACTN|nr:hypothetical protein [Actinocrinis puniceicyclus]MBS2966858.1 hypothetical protein [Actinocrinis puniceicyclus]
MQSSKIAGILAGGALGVSLLGHPSGIFAVPAIAFVLALLWIFPVVRPQEWVPPARSVLVAASAALGLAYLPWMLYPRPRS